MMAMRSLGDFQNRMGQLGQLGQLGGSQYGRTPAPAYHQGPVYARPAYPGDPPGGGWGPPPQQNRPPQMGLGGGNIPGSYGNDPTFGGGTYRPQPQASSPTYAQMYRQQSQMQQPPAGYSGGGSLMPGGLSMNSIDWSHFSQPRTPPQMLPNYGAGLLALNNQFMQAHQAANLARNTGYQNLLRGLR